MVINCKKPCKKKRSTMLTVEQMVDIALGTPEIGAVNFNVLHALIHVIIQQLNIQKCLVEFKGYDSDRMEGIILSAKPGPILKLSEYMIDVNDGRPCPPKDKMSKQSKDEVEEGKDEGKETSPKRAPCECGGKKKKPAEEEKEKSDKGKDDSEVEEKKTKIKKELLPEECEEEEEPEPKRVREVEKPKKPCPCKAKQEQDVCADETLRAVPSSYYGSDSEGTCQTIVRVEPVGERCDSWRSRPALAHESMIKLEEKVAMLQDAFEALEQMPTNEELKKRTQGTGCASTPVKDLWQTYNLNKRVESCEGTIEKLASMIEDLVKETCNFREAMMVIAGAVDDIECADQTGRSCCAALQGQSAPPQFPPRAGSKTGETQTVTFKEDAPPPEEPSKAESAPAAQAPKVTKGLPCPPKKEGAAAASEPERPAAQPAPAVPSTSAPAPPPAPAAAPSSAPPPAAPESAPQVPESSAEPRPPAEQADTTATGKPETDAQEAKSEPAALDSRPRPAGASELTPIGPEFYKMSAGEKFCLLKEYVDCLVCQMKNSSANQSLQSKLCALVSLQKQVDSLEKEWREFLASVGPDGVKGLVKMIKKMSADIERLDGILSKMLSEQRNLENVAMSLSSDAENLKKMKADVEYVEDLLAGKADAALLNRKVSHDQFDAACDDLTRGLDEALEKLMQQEAMWNEAMEEIQRVLESKLDKLEIMPLKEFINKKLKCLQDKLKQLAQLRKDAEAAGAKTRIIRNMNCIACDADVIMKMDNRVQVAHPAMHPSKNLKPLLTFELDNVRKAMKKGPPCKPATHVEEPCPDTQRKLAGIPLTHRDAVDNKVAKIAHFCNRYCGGSHTITTPQQRVTRIGHFLTEFGPQALALFNQECEEPKPIQPGPAPDAQCAEGSRPC